VAALGLGGAACSLLVSTSDLRERRVEGGTADGSSDVQSSPPDGAPDAAGRFCATLGTATPFFCDAFDDGGALAGWMIRAVGGTVEWDEKDSLSSPASAVMTNIPPNGDLWRPATIHRSFSPSSRFRIHFALRGLQAPIGVSELQPFALDLSGTDLNVYGLNVTTFGGVANLEEEYRSGSSGEVTYLENPFTVKVDWTAWHRFELVVDFTGRTAELRMDGAPVASIPALKAAKAPSSALLTVGITYLTSTTSTFGVRVDDVAAVPVP
jgi:hypothetical protein